MGILAELLENEHPTANNCAGCTENEAKPGESLCEQCDRVTMRPQRTREEEVKSGIFP